MKYTFKDNFGHDLHYENFTTEYEACRLSHVQLPGYREDEIHFYKRTEITNEKTILFGLNRDYYCCPWADHSVLSFNDLSMNQTSAMYVYGLNSVQNTKPNILSARV